MASVDEDSLNRVIEAVCAAGNLSGLRADEDFYDAGFSSINALQLLMDLENTFDIMIPDDEFVAARTCTDLHNLVSRLAK